MKRDPSLDTLLALHGQVLVVDPEGHHWVRFVVRRVPASGWSVSTTPMRCARGPDRVAEDERHKTTDTG